MGKTGKYIPDCKACGDAGERNERFDAYFCKGCNIWLEKGCSGASCEFCADRPSTLPTGKSIDNTFGG